MSWLCKRCSDHLPTRSDILKHYRLHHGTFSHSNLLPCIYLECPCSFKTWSGLHSHLSRCHVESQTQRPEIVLSFTCLVCRTQGFPTEREYFAHVGHHLKSNETVECVFEGCDFQTNIYGTFTAHKHRKHTPHILSDFKGAVILEKPNEEPTFEPDNTGATDENMDEGSGEGTSSGAHSVEKDDRHLIVDHIASFLLKLESVHNVSNRCIDELIDEMQFMSSASIPIIRDVVESHLKKNNCVIDSTVVTSLFEELNESSPISMAFDKAGPLSSAFKRRRYFLQRFNVVEPVEYILDPNENKSFQYVPILESLKQILNNEDIREKFLTDDGHTSIPAQYRSFRDSAIYRGSDFYSEEQRICIFLYVDDFEVCNPLGTSRRKHKITAVYWILGNIQSCFRSTLTSVYLALLCKANDIKRFGYAEVLKPLLDDIAILEQDGILIPVLGKTVKGTVYCVVADNLGAHSVAGLVESFSGPYICRFCLGEHVDFQEKEVRSGAFHIRTKEDYSVHVKALQANPALHHCFGVKRPCPLTEKLSHFHMVEGYPPDILHDLFEGIIPMELALCFRDFIAKKYITLDELNNKIKSFPYKWGDKTDSPQSIPIAFSTRKSIGGNAHENWTLIRLLPLMIGHKIPLNDPAWNVIMCLKDIVELVVAPTQTEASLSYLDAKISEHRLRLLSAFPQVKLIPKHHFLEHYPTLIKEFGPLIALWTMRFEGKHRYFKQIVRHTGNFKNVLFSLATKHQLMIAHHLHATTTVPTFSTARVSQVPVAVLHTNVHNAIRRVSPGQTTVHLSNTVSVYGTTYSKGMILAYGSTAGLPDFIEVLQIVILRDKVHFIAKVSISWYDEHFQAFELESTELVVFVEQKDLTDVCPHSDYKVAGRHMVTLKRHICLE